MKSPMRLGTPTVWGHWRRYHSQRIGRLAALRYDAERRFEASGKTSLTAAADYFAFSGRMRWHIAQQEAV